MPATSPLAKSALRESVAVKARRIRAMLRDFNDDERGMNTVEAVILLFVAAIVLIIFLTVIWPYIGDSVMTALKNLFGQGGEIQQ